MVLAGRRNWLHIPRILTKCAMTAPTRSCTSCETPIPDGALFCSHCGEATPTEISRETGQISPIGESGIDENEFRQRLQNARWIAATADERLTLVTCWPNTTNSHRLIIVAEPVGDMQALALPPPTERRIFHES